MGNFILFTKIVLDKSSSCGSILLILTTKAASAIRKAIPVFEEIYNNEIQAIKNHICLCSDHHTFISSQF